MHLPKGTGVITPLRSKLFIISDTQDFRRNIHSNQILLKLQHRRLCAKIEGYFECRFNKGFR